MDPPLKIFHFSLCDFGEERERVNTKIYVVRQCAYIHRGKRLMIPLYEKLGFTTYLYCPKTKPQPSTLNFPMATLAPPMRSLNQRPILLSHLEYEPLSLIAPVGKDQHKRSFWNLHVVLGILTLEYPSLSCYNIFSLLLPSFLVQQ